MSGFDLDDTTCETSPLELIRAALMKLNDLGNESVPEVSTLLQVSSMHTKAVVLMC